MSLLAERLRAMIGRNREQWLPSEIDQALLEAADALDRYEVFGNSLGTYYEIERHEDALGAERNEDD